MLLLRWQLWESLPTLGLEVNRGQPDLSPEEDGYNPGVSPWSLARWGWGHRAGKGGRHEGLEHAHLGWEAQQLQW